MANYQQQYDVLSIRFFVVSHEDNTVIKYKGAVLLK